MTPEGGPANPPRETRVRCVCGKIVSAYVPKGGDGSFWQTRPHAVPIEQRKNRRKAERCAGLSP